MTTRFLLAFAFLFASGVVEDGAQELALPPRRYMTPEILPKYHTDDTYDRVAHNSLKKRMLRASRREALLETGISHIPDQLTVTCPEQPVLLAPAFGHDTKWIMENKSSGDVVVLFVSNGVEYIAFNQSITPPQADPNAVLKPGEWMAVDTFEGHGACHRRCTLFLNLPPMNGPKWKATCCRVKFSSMKVTPFIAAVVLL